MAAFTVLAHTEMSSNGANITHTGLSSSYDHLLLRWSIRDATNNYYGDAGIYFNSTANGSTYPLSYRTLHLTASSLTSTNQSGGYALFGFKNVGNTATSGVYSNGSCWIPQYSTTGNGRPIILHSACSNAASSSMQSTVMAGYLGNTANAISAVTLFNQSGSQFLSGSWLTVYGVNGAT